MAKTTLILDVVDNDGSFHAVPLQVLVDKNEVMTRTTPARHLDESGMGPKKSRIQSGSSSSSNSTKYMQSPQNLPPDRSDAVTSYALARCYDNVPNHRKKMMP
jgi:hypothetical protein